MSDRGVLQPHSLVRGGSLQAGEDLPGRASIPGVLVGMGGGVRGLGGGGRGFATSAPSKKAGVSWE